MQYKTWDECPWYGAADLLLKEATFLLPVKMLLVIGFLL